MRRTWLLLASLILLFGSCTDEQLVEEKLQKEEIIEPTTPERVVLKVNSPSVVANVTTRGTGAVGEIENEETQSLWHNEELHIFAINKYATDLTKELTGREDYNIPTFLMGDTTGVGVVGTAPDAQKIDFVKDWHAEDTPLYYPLNGAYNFFGFHTDDAHLSKQENDLAEDKSTLHFDVTFNGTQDIMIAKAELTDDDKLALIESMIKNGSAGLSGEAKDYYDVEQHKLISDPEGKISAEFEKAFSSYAARRDVHPTMQFEHQLARLTFKVITDDKNARVRPAGDPKLNIQRYTERPYVVGEFFHYNNKYYLVVKNINTAMKAEDLFPNGNTSVYLKRVAYFSTSEKYSIGDNVLYDNRYYQFLKDYQGAWPGDAEIVADQTKTFLQYRTYRTYVFGDVIVDPFDAETGEEKIYICPSKIDASQNRDLKSIKSRLLDYQQGVFISQIRIPDVNCKGVISINKDKICYETTTQEKDTFFLGERDSSAVNKRLPNAPFPKLKSQVIAGDTIPMITPTGPTEEAVRVGESMLVPSADSYQLLITTQEYVDSKGNIIGEKNAIDSIPAVTIRPESGSFEAGKSYDITIKVTSTRIIEVTAKLSDWDAGKKVEDVDTSGDSNPNIGRIDGHHYLYFGTVNNEDSISIKYCFDGKNRNFLYKEIPQDGFPRESYIFENIYCNFALCHWLFIPWEYEITEITGTQRMIGQSYLQDLDKSDDTKYRINGEKNGLYRLLKIKNGNFQFEETYLIKLEKKRSPSDQPEQDETQKENNQE